MNIPNHPCLLQAKNVWEKIANQNGRSKLPINIADHRIGSLTRAFQRKERHASNSNQMNHPQPQSPTAASDDRHIYSTARGIAVKILTRVERSDAYLDKLLGAELSQSDLSDADKRLLNEITTGVLRWRGRLDWVLTGFYHGEFSKCLSIVKNAMRVALYQIMFLERIPHSAAVNESVEIVKRLKGEKSAAIVNGVLRSVIRKLNSITWPDRSSEPSYYLAAVQSHPQWLVRRWIEEFGMAETGHLLEANNQRPRLTLRVNLLRTTREAVEQQLAADGIKTSRSPWLPSVLNVDGGFNINANGAFRQGLFTVQDEGATLAMHLAAPSPGIRVIDLCAAPGGKSTAMAELMQGQGQVIALDKYEPKLKLIDEAAERLGLAQVIRTAIGDASNITLPPADLVVVDAPCSGLGTLSKKPDIKWKREPEDIPQLAALQRAILANAAKLVKPGGVLLYSTCTIERRENQEVVEAFLADHPEFRLEPASEWLPKGMVTPEGFMQTLPHRHGLDGMFAARLRRGE